MNNKNTMKKEWTRPEVASLELNDTMNNGLNNGNGNGWGHCKHGNVPGIGNGHDKYDSILCS